MSAANGVEAMVRPTMTGDCVLADLQSPVSFSMPTPPSTNHLFKNVRGVGRVRTSEYDDFIHCGVTAIQRQLVRPIAGYVMAIIGVERMSLSADIDNRLKAMLDVIVKANVVKDDNMITSIAISWLPKANGLSWVRLLPVQSLTLDFHPSQDGASGAWIINAPQANGDEDGYQPI